MNEKIAEIQQLNKEKSKFMSPGFRKLIQLGARRWAIFSQKINSLRKLNWPSSSVAVRDRICALCFVFFSKFTMLFKMNIDWCRRSNKNWIGQTKKLLLVKSIFITKPAINRGNNWGIFYRSAQKKTLEYFQKT